MNFDFNNHFKQFSHRPFFNEWTYADLFSDVKSFSSSLKEESVLGLKIKSPYLFFVALLSSLMKEKMAVLLSPLETQDSLKVLQGQIHFERLIEDGDFHILKTQDDIQFQKPDAKKMSIIVFSSGSTSTPKGIALNLENIYYSAKGFNEYFDQLETEKSFLNLPHHHVGGLMLLWRAFFSGGSVTTDPEALVDFISLVPLQLKRWLSDEKKCAFLRHCRVILIGGAPLTPALRMEAQKHGLRLYETYGMSETASLLMVNGEVLPYREVTLDERGHFLVKGRTLSKGHFLKNIFIPHSGEWFKTNDLGRRDKTGRFTFIERADLVFISGGENINPLMIEEIVKENGAIKDAYLVPLKDEKWGEMGLLLYENIEGANQTGRELMAHLKKRLHPYQVPKFFFECKLSFEGQLKAKRSELKQMARELFLKSLFSHDFYPKNNAPVMVFFHGFLGDKEDLKEIAKSLGEHYSLLFVDLPGHGKTKIEHFHSTEDIFYQLASFVRLFDSAPLFYGYSMGGRIALQLSLKYLTPQFLILESAGLGLQSIDEQTRRKQADLELFNGFKDSAEFLKYWYQNPLFDVFRNAKNFKTECKRKSHHEMSEWKTSQLYLSQGCFPLKEENSKSLKEASFPLLYIYGSEDKLYAQNSKEMKESAAVQGAGHNPHKTHPTEIKEILIKKLK